MDLGRELKFSITKAMGLLLFFCWVPAEAKTPQSSCSNGVFLTELLMRTRCQEYKKAGCLNQKKIQILECRETQYECDAIQVAQRTDAPGEVLSFMLSTGMAGEEIQKAAKTNRISPNLSKLMSDYRHDLQNVNFIRNLLGDTPEGAKKLMSDPEMLRADREAYEKTMEKKAEIYKKLGVRMLPPERLTPMNGPLMPLYSGSHPAERYLAVRERAIQEMRTGEYRISGQTIKDLKVAWKDLQAFRGSALKASASAAGRSSTIANLRGGFLTLLPEIVDPGNLGALDYHRATCPKENFAGYDAVPKEMKSMIGMGMLDCKLVVSPNGVAWLLSADAEAIGLLDKTPSLCNAMQAQLEDLRSQQGLYRQRTGRIQKSSPGSSK